MTDSLAGLSPEIRAALLTLAPLIDELRAAGAELPAPRAKRRAAKADPLLPPKPALTPARQDEVERSLKKGGYGR